MVEFRGVLLFVQVRTIRTFGALFFTPWFFTLGWSVLAVVVGASATFGTFADGLH